MSALAFASMFTGAVIFVWGLRATRNGRVKVLYFQMRSRKATLIFGMVASLCGLLMVVTGAADASSLPEELANRFAHAALFGFAAGWAVSLLIEGLARIGWRISPHLAPMDLRAKRKRAAPVQRKRRNDNLSASE